MLTPRGGQRCGVSATAARWTEQREELAIGDRQIDVRQRGDIAEFATEMFKNHLRHVCLLRPRQDALPDNAVAGQYKP